ncbi:MAG: Gfo/Idh/MocA family oxidoreductase [Candidatus Poribacteria bacterium]|nr:Gfo/Idh/MocA family oxidoreductase [Candidatus Poribacteria bacterium]
MLKRYRVGIVGCGHISRTHMHAYRTVFATDVVTAAEVVEDRRQAFSEEYRIATLYNDYREMLDNEDLDIISVCTLADSHCEITVAAAERGIHVLCEKPMALDLEEADRMIDACKQAGVKLAIDHHRRGDARYHFAQQLIADGAIGELQAIIAEGATAGVGLMETATHLYDSIRIFGGDVDWVFAHITTNGDDISSNDMVHAPSRGLVAGDNAPAYFYFKNGIYAMVHSFGDFGVELIGTKGRMVIKEGYKPRSQPHLFGIWTHDSSEWQLITTERDELITPSHFRLAYARVAQEMIDCIEEDRAHCSSGEEGRAALELIMAVYKSQRTGARVKLPLDVRVNPLK